MKKTLRIIMFVLFIILILGLSIYLPNKDKINEEVEDKSIIYSLIEENGKYGVKDQNDEIIVQIQYEKIIIPNEHRDVFFCYNGEQKTILDKNNKTIFEEYDNVDLIKLSNISENVYEKNALIYQKNEKFGLLSITGNIILEAKYDEIYSLGYKENEIIVKENNKYMIYDTNGKNLIKDVFDSIQSDEFYTEEDEYRKSGYIVCKITSDGYRYGYYDYEYNKVLEINYNQISRILDVKNKNNIYLIASLNGQFGVFINNTKVIDTQYQSINYDSELEVFIVERTGKYGAISLKGKEILKAEYNELKVNGLYIYTLKDEEKKVWDTNGLEVDINYETIIQKTDSKEYFIKNEGGYYSILNNNMEEISKGKYKYLEFIYDNYFIATNETDKSGIIDSQENLIIEYKYDIIQKVKGTLVIQAVEFNTDKTIFYDKEFNLIKEIANANIEYLENGFKVYNDEQEIILDTNGKIIDK